MHQPLRGIPQILATLLALGLMGGAAAGQPLARDDVPAPLEPWVDWVLRGHERERCPSLHGAGDRRACIWPSRLELDLRDGEGRFVQEWLVSTESHVPLPGTARRWPQDVRADRAPVPVVSRDGVPAVRLSAGRHVLTGSFHWDRLPDLLQIPPETGIVALTVRGREVALPNRDVKGRLWLRKKGDAAPTGAQQRLDVTVHRRVADEIPVELETRVKLDVAGRSREVVLGRALPDGFVPLALASALPARLDPDGRLRMQVRPGTWRLTLRARHRGPVQALGLPEPGGPWDPSEVWVFDPRPQLRVVTVEDGVAVDPSQTTLPDEWRRLPAYLMETGRTLRFVEKRRGDSDPAPDELRLSRTFWLDFDGRGYTVSDDMSGVIRRGSRLEMGPATQLGRVELNGRDALITRLDGSPLVGVEVPPGSLRLLADSRVE